MSSKVILHSQPNNSLKYQSNRPSFSGATHQIKVQKVKMKIKKETYFKKKSRIWNKILEIKKIVALIKVHNNKISRKLNQ